MAALAAPLLSSVIQDSTYVTRVTNTSCFSRACVSSSETKASEIGVDILRAGGNAADATVAVAAALNVLFPASTGIGGDCFCLFYDATSQTVKGLNGSGRSSSELSLDAVAQRGFDVDNPIPGRHALNVTVPGAAAGWVDTVDEFGSGNLTLEQILQPAIDLAESGFVVQPVAAETWKTIEQNLHSPERNPHTACYLTADGKAPSSGDVMRCPLLAKTFKELAHHGKPGFYEGQIARAIVDIVRSNRGILTLQDLKSHTSLFVEPISVDYKGLTTWEMPPNTQGLATLIALNILEGIDLKAMGHNTARYLHTLIETIKLSFADTLRYCCDDDHFNVPVQELLSKEYAAVRRKLIDPKRASSAVCHGDVGGSSDTVYFSVVDDQGNACSFINSIYMLFGSGLVPEDCGFALNNRGACFSLVPSHPNVLGPGKRPYNTIIPAMVTDMHTREFLAAFGVMGGYMQPQGQLQVLLSMAEFGEHPQKAVDSPRFYVEPVGRNRPFGQVSLEVGFSDDIITELRSMGHDIVGPVRGWERLLFGRGQVITAGKWWYPAKDDSDQCLYAGSDVRGDGVPVGY